MDDKMGGVKCEKQKNSKAKGLFCFFFFPLFGMFDYSYYDPESLYDGVTFIEGKKKQFKGDMMPREQSKNS